MAIVWDWKFHCSSLASHIDQFDHFILTKLTVHRTTRYCAVTNCGRCGITMVTFHDDDDDYENLKKKSSGPEVINSLDVELDRCRQATTLEEQTISWNALIDGISQSDSTTVARIAQQVLVEWPYNSLYSRFIDQLFDVCGRAVTIASCSALLQQLGKQEVNSTKIPPSSILQTCWAILQRQLLSKNSEQEPSSLHDTKNDIERLVKLVLAIPTLMANACHACKIRLPLLATSSRYFPRLVDCSWRDALSHDFPMYLIKALLANRNNATPIAIGLAPHHPLSESVLNMISWNHREWTNLIIALLQHCAASEDPALPTRVLVTCHTLLKSASIDQKDALLQHIVFKPLGDTRLCPLFVSLLERCDILLSSLCDVAEQWSKWSFVQQIPTAQQHFVSQILLEGIQRTPMCDDDPLSVINDDALILHLLQGVTHRLESFVPGIRLDGMRIAKHVARRRNQVLQFDELFEAEQTVSRKGDGNKTNNLNGEDLLPIEPTNLKPPSKIIDKKSHKKKTRLRDPDEEFDSDEENESIPTSEDDTSTVYDDELVPYSLDDDEEDLLETPKPLYLLQALELLRTGDADEHAYSNHETALRALPELIRKRPDDLRDVVISLLMELLRIEDKFGIDEFLHLRQKSLVSLAVMEPMTVGNKVIEMVFKDNSLSDRLACFGALQEAAYELSGSKDLDKRAIQSLDENTFKDSSTQQISRLESKTRRKRSPRMDPMTVKNLFTPIAPVWFYSLTGQFLKERDNHVLWSGSTGSQLLASLFRTLAVIVEFAGIVASPVLAKDLMELVWPFVDADVAEVRLAVLTSITTFFAVLPDDRVLPVLLEQMQSLPQSIASMAQTDPDNDCRQLATTLSQSFFKILEEIQYPLLKN